ncbi:MAG: phosphate-starvation-inducible PsiE family protein [Nitrospirota bacterium]
MAKDYERGGGAPELICKIRRILIFADDAVHVLVAAALLLSALFMLMFTATNFAAINVSSILLVINDVLFVLIIMELLWTVIRYLKRQEFSLKPFLAIGIISSLRRILMLEAQMSINGHADYYPLEELGVSAAIVLVLVFSYYLMNRVEGKSA